MAEKDSSGVMPAWHAPPMASGAGLQNVAYPLQMMNSLTRTKTPFVPKNGRHVLWYMCGPTVYDSAHMGHARTYISFDILRRIMSSYFNYDVTLCMNITDVDDKIIMRANESGRTFDALSREHEASFLEDMRVLGVAPPDVMTRVSEYVPEVVTFIQGIIANGYAYASNGSVYFDTEAYRKAPHHHYGKLVPENVGNAAATEEGEGALSVSVGAVDKRAGCDFALWKASKAGEPSWPSPWGEGRPGWHIECSAMCGDTLGGLPGSNGCIDIHSGGVDLRFPHHENEIAQSEACLDCAQWVNYFVHSGHLNIEGLKMSKSLKNFVKIGDAVRQYGARGLRFLFLNQRYNAPMNYSEDAMEGVAGLQKVFSDFFANVKVVLREQKIGGRQKWGGKDKAFAALVEATKVSVREALCDDFNTPGAMGALRELVGHTNKYLKEEGGAPVSLLVASAGNFVTDMFRVFGLVDPLPGVGWGEDGGGGGGGGGGSGEASREAILAPILDTLASYREGVNAIAKALPPTSPDNPTPKLLLTLGDTLRATLKTHCVKLEDKPAAAAAAASGGAAGALPPPPFGTPVTSSWKVYSQEEMRLEEEAIARAKEEKERNKALLAAKEARKKVDPKVMFLEDPLYSAWDDTGIPTKDAAGVELNKDKRKMLESQWRAQEKDYTKWLSKSGGVGGGEGGEKQ